jgi:hypothetical protein
MEPIFFSTDYQKGIIEAHLGGGFFLVNFREYHDDGSIGSFYKIINGDDMESWMIHSSLKNMREMPVDEPHPTMLMAREQKFY